MDDDVFAEFFRIAHFYNFLNGVSNDGVGEACRNIRHGGPFFLCLLHFRIHKHGAAAAEIHRRLRIQCHVGEIFHAVFHAFGKGLEEGAAAR